MAKHKVADIIVEVLQSAGVQRCYGVVGDTLNHVTDAIRRSERDWVPMRHEERERSSRARRLSSRVALPPAPEAAVLGVSISSTGFSNRIGTEPRSC
jgi:hypothetical protein